MKKTIDVYIASCAPDGGVLHCRLDSDFSLHPADFTAADRPMYLAREGNVLWGLLRAPDGYGGNSAFCRFAVRGDGALSGPEIIGSTGGEVACHLYVDSGAAYCVNYISGSVMKFPDRLVRHDGKGPDPVRQVSAHPHFIGRIPRSPFLCAADLGTDTLYVYDRQLHLRSMARVPAGRGARHIAFSPDGAVLYCVNELGSTISVFAHRDGRLRYLRDYPTLPDGVHVSSTAAAIRISGDGRQLYASNRGHDSIAWYSVEGARLDLREIVPCGGACPRDFNVIGDVLLCANEQSDSVTVFRLSGGRPVFTGKALQIASPLCIAF